MKKAIILPILLLFTVLVTSCSKDKDKEPTTEDKSAEVSQTYQGQLKLGNGQDILNTYNNVKVKVTRKAAHEVTLEPVSGQAYPAFAPIAYSKFMFISSSNGYVSSNPGSIIFTFTSDGNIKLVLGHTINGAPIFFDGTNVK